MAFILGAIGLVGVFCIKREFAVRVDGLREERYLLKNRFIKFPSIEQYRNIVKAVQHGAAYVGEDENGNPIYDRTLEKPTLKFTGTVKMHGTNAGVTFNKATKDIYAQSRNNIITPEKDNAGFAFFVKSKEDDFNEIFSEVVMSLNRFGLDYDYITLFGEWCGKGIQKGVALNELERMFVVFDVKFSTINEDGELEGRWMDPVFVVQIIKSGAAPPKILHSMNFKTYYMAIDFNRPELSQNQLGEFTEEVEKECPVASKMGVQGIGEGIVYRHQDEKGNVLRFKVKGNKHSSSKVKTLAAVDVEKIATVDKFVEYAVTTSRLEQAIKEVFGDEEIDIKRMSDFLRWIMNDIIKEETDALIENNLTPKDVGKSVSDASRRWFMELWQKI
jgi:hypothetical protein